MLSSCSEIDNLGTTLSDDNIISIGGVETGEMSVETRAGAVDAETIDWLVQPLEQGLDITYGLSGVLKAESNEDVAILKLTNKTTTPATYTFYYRKDGVKHRTETEKAIWYNNGYHYFQGVHVPERIRYITNVSEVDASGKAPDLMFDQHNDNATGADSELGNYTLLSHYLGMPANYKLTATVERIKLPFRHRLARVVAFVLIDPELHTKLKGYSLTDGKDDPNTTSLRFCNVKVLQGVKDVVDNASQHHTLTPTWKSARKVVPHFDGERGSYNYKTQTSLDEDFKMYVGTSEGKAEELYPTSNTWKSYHDASDHKGYKEINYGKVPVYDIIVRPTYKTWEDVMYDEEGYVQDSESTLRSIASTSNSIDFEIELENGLRYEKTFEFDLNANYQTVVYLRISREKVDYDDAGSEIWVEEKRNDGWYGTDNENGNTLSYAGSSWQRAYTFGAEVGENHTDANHQDGVTDGHFYNATSSAEDQEKAQYFTSAYQGIWVEKFLQAYKEGKHHGDYFVLQSNISIDARLIPEDFIFTGHLDGQDKIITLTNVGEKVVDQDAWDEDNYLIATEDDYAGVLYEKNGSGEYLTYNIPELYIKIHHDAVKYTEEEAATINALHLIDYVKPAEYYNQDEINAAKAIVEAEDYVEGSNPDAEDVAAKTTDDIKTPAVEIHPNEDGYVTTYDSGYTPIDENTIKTSEYDEYIKQDITVAQLMNSDVSYYIKLDGDSYEIYPKPTLYANHPIHHDEIWHTSPAYLFAGLNGEYTTKQEGNSSLPASEWEANVHKETNKTTVWVPTLGYRAEVLNVQMADGATLFKTDAHITGNVQNCFNLTADGKVSVTNTPNIPQYKQ